MTLNYIPFSPTVEALCTNTQCPLTSGPNDRSTSSTWPDSVSGKVVSKIEWNGVDGSQLLCIQITASIAARENRTSLRGAILLHNDTHMNTSAVAVAEALRLNAPIELQEIVAYSPWAPAPALLGRTGCC